MTHHPLKPKLSSVRHYLVKHRDALILITPHCVSYEEAKTIAIKHNGIVTNQSWWDRQKTKNLTPAEFFRLPA